MSTPATAATLPVRLEQYADRILGRSSEHASTVIGADPITGESITWTGRGRKADHTDATTRDLDRFLSYAEARFSALLAAGDSPLGRFQSEGHLKAFATRLNAMRNRAFNACRAAQAAERRGAARGSGEAPCGHSCQEVEAA